MKFNDVHDLREGLDLYLTKNPSAKITNMQILVRNGNDVIASPKMLFSYREKE